VSLIAATGALWLVAAPLRAGAAEDEGASRVAAERGGLVGRWTLNADLSEDPREKMRQARPERPPGGPGGGGMNPPSGGGRDGGRPPGRGAGEGPDPGAVAFLRAKELTITNIEPEVSIVEPDGLVRRLHPDGKKYKTSSGAEVKTRWDGPRLVVETKSERGKVKETWTVSPASSGAKRLTVTLEIQQPWGAAVSVKRVFDPLPEDEGPP
jgi:hypothetical protein